MKGVRVFEQITTQEVKEGVKWLGGVAVALFAWGWKHLNGEIKAAKAVAAACVPSVHFQEFCDRYDERDKQYRGMFKELFDQMKEHKEEDNKIFQEIQRSLGRLETQVERKRHEN
jgi:hypothetical protein